MKKGNAYKNNDSVYRAFLRAVCFCGAALIIALGAFPLPLGQAKDVYPAEKIHWIIPYKAGGGFDLMARAISPYLSKYLREASPGTKGGDLLIKNEPAAGGRKAYSTVYNAKRDGYTIGGFDISFATESLLEKVDFDMGKLTFLLRAMSTNRIIVTAKNGFANWEEMLKYSKTKELKWGTGAFLKATQIDSIIITERVGIPVRFIPWAGGTAECMNALMRGDVQVALVSDDSVKGLVNAGEIRILAVVSEKSQYPGVPSIRDLGYPDLAEKLGGHRFVIAPPELPQEIKNTFITAYKKALQDKDFQAWAKKSDMPLNPTFGDEAEREAQKMMKYYQNDVKPLVMKYAK